MNISSKIFFIILIYEINFLARSTASKTRTTKPHLIGICKVNKTTTTPVIILETINEPQLQNYPCSDGSGKLCTKQIMVMRNISKTVQVPGFRLVNVCCKGYMKVGRTCVPKCYPECEHGSCIKPDTCKCDRGYKALTNSKCTPDCQNCQNGYCLTPFDCKCYSLYEKSANGTCVPRCDPECVNSDCLTPGVCTCHDGYGADTFSNHRCNAICQKSCGEGGHCIAPNICECISGYRLNGTSQCEPICENCDNGVCEKPGECVCNENYKTNQIENRCEPICQVSCGVGGHCIAPNICKCSSGYRLNVTHQCDPICENCDNGLCLKPGECVCNENYEINQIENRCEPVCQVACGDGGRCIAPNICECISGYRLNATHQCEPVCENCDNGVCVKPGECVCNENYKTNQIENRCEPVCQVSCGVGGHCIAPNICKCSSGYRLNVTHQCEPICENCDNGLCLKPGECVCNENYEINQIENRCEPVCEIPCGDGGHCIAPDVCECSIGYHLNMTRQCQPICDDCDNGICVKPGECECNINYEMVEKVCEPICTDPCVHGFCSNVDECTCDKGYERDMKIKHVCNRICDPPCINGLCTEENECKCLPGFLEHIFKDHECLDCNYTCTESEDCPIPDGCPCAGSEEFNMETNSCERLPATLAPLCSGECVNSNCTYGQCICLDGYNKLSDDSNICFALCNNKVNGCINGNCSHPEVCTCGEGFTLSNYTKYECILIEESTNTSTTEFVEENNDIVDQRLGSAVECLTGDCHREMEQIRDGGVPQLLKAHFNYILIAIAVIILSVIIILTMIYRKYNRTKTFKTHEQEAFLSSPYFIGGPIKTSCDIELDDS